MSAARPASAYRNLSVVIFLLLIVQFLLGMWANLFVVVTRHHPGANASYFPGAARSILWALSHGGPLLEAHVGVGLLLFVLGVRLLVLAVRTGEPGLAWWPVVGLVGVFAAGGNGASYLDFGKDFSSMLMAAGFAVAMFGFGMAMRWSGPTSLSGLRLGTRRLA